MRLNIMTGDNNFAPFHEFGCVAGDGGIRALNSGELLPAVDDAKSLLPYLGFQAHP